jgi:UDP-N-acetylmuramate--alanine ligase
LACILKAQGKNVFGSDEGDHFYYDVLKKANINVFHKFDEGNLREIFTKKVGAKASKARPLERAKQVKGLAFSERNKENKIDLIIYSTAIQPETNPELKYAMETSEQHFKILSYPQALGLVFNQAETGIAVCGTHGKTTTTAMLATTLQKVGAEPTALVGSKVLEWKGNTLISCEGPTFAKSQRSDLCNKHFVIEADEYQNKLQYYKPQIVILTSADYDHPDFFKTEEDYLQVFKDFVARIPKNGFLVAYAGDKNVLEISKAANCEIIFYDELSVKSGILEGSLCPDNNCHGKKAGCCSTAKQENKLVGMHNLLNATAALRVIQKLGLDEGIAIKALREFQGTVRRFEIKGKYNEAVIVDDYAHHPTEVRATLRAAKEKYPDKTIKCIFHPHTFTRTEALLDEFGDSFGDADEIYLLDIFGSAREKQGGVSSDDLIEKIKEQEKNNQEDKRGKRVGLAEASKAGLIKRSDSEVLSPAFGEQSDKKLDTKRLKTIKNLHTIPEATKYFQKNLTKNDILITMGAGDVYLIAGELMEN